MTKALRTYEKFIQNACGRTHRGKRSIQRGHINEKYTFFPPMLQIPGAINSSILHSSDPWLKTCVRLGPMGTNHRIFFSHQNDGGHMDRLRHTPKRGGYLIFRSALKVSTQSLAVHRSLGTGDGRRPGSLRGPSSRGRRPPCTWCSRSYIARAGCAACNPLQIAREGRESILCLAGDGLS